MSPTTHVKCSLCYANLKVTNLSRHLQDGHDISVPTMMPRLLKNNFNDDCLVWPITSVHVECPFCGGHIWNNIYQAHLLRDHNLAPSRLVNLRLREVSEDDVKLAVENKLPVIGRGLQDYNDTELTYASSAVVENSPTNFADTAINQVSNEAFSGDHAVDKSPTSVEIVLCSPDRTVEAQITVPVRKEALSKSSDGLVLCEVPPQPCTEDVHSVHETDNEYVEYYDDYVPEVWCEEDVYTSTQITKETTDDRNNKETIPSRQTAHYVVEVCEGQAPVSCNEPSPHHVDEQPANAPPLLISPKETVADMIPNTGVSDEVVAEGHSPITQDVICTEPSTVIAEQPANAAAPVCTPKEPSPDVNPMTLVADEVVAEVHEPVPQDFVFQEPATHVAERPVNATQPLPRHKETVPGVTRSNLVSDEVEKLSLEVDYNFATLEHFKDYFKRYAEKNLIHYFIRRSTKTVGDWSDKFSHQNIVIKCVHAGEVPCKTLTKRCKQAYFAKGCKFEIVCKLDKAIGRFFVSSFKKEHSHPVSQEFYNLHPNARRLNKVEREVFIQSLSIAVGTPNRRIVELIEEESGKKVTGKDVRNAIAKELGGLKTNDVNNGIKYLETHLERNPGALLDIGYVYSEEERDMGRKADLKYVLWQSPMMKKHFEANASVLFLDGTYNLCSSGYILINIMAINSHHVGQVVGWILVADEKKDTITLALKKFKEANEVASAKVENVMMDKDFSEIQSVQEIFPNSFIVLCRWHIMQAVKRHLAGCGFTKDNSNLKHKITHLVDKMLKANTEDLYRTELEKLANLAEESTPCQSFYDYFLVNWHEIRSHICYYSLKRRKLYDSYTNNRSENYNSQLKRSITRRSKFLSILQSLMNMERKQNNNLIHSNYLSAMKSLKINDGKETYDRLNLVNWCNEKKLCKAGIELLLYQLAEVPKVNADNLLLATEQTVCTLLEDGPCTFNATNKLPCKHILKVRMENSETLLEDDMFDMHWLNPIDRHLPEVPNPPTTATYTKMSTAQQHVRSAKESTNLLLSTLKDAPQKERRERLQLMSDWNEYLNLCQTPEEDNYEIPPSTQPEDISSQDLSMSRKRKSHLLNACLSVPPKPKKPRGKGRGRARGRGRGRGTGKTNVDAQILNDAFNPRNKIDQYLVSAPTTSNTVKDKTRGNCLPLTRGRGKGRGGRKSAKTNTVGETSYLTEAYLPKSQIEAQLIPTISTPEGEIDKDMFAAANINVSKILGQALGDIDLISLTDPSHPRYDKFFSDRHMDIAGLLISAKASFLKPMQSVLQNCTFGYSPCKGQPFMQFLLVSNCHWVVVSNINLGVVERFNEIELYDTKLGLKWANNEFTATLDKSLQMNIAQLMRTEEVECDHTIFVKVKRCHQQDNYYDCGPLSVCIATALSHNLRVDNCYFVGDLRREYLNRYVEADMTAFPVEDSTRHPQNFRKDFKIGKRLQYKEIADFYVEVYVACHCCLPLWQWNTFVCTNCKRNFHYQCYLVGRNVEHLLSCLKVCYNCRATDVGDPWTKLGKADAAKCEAVAGKFENLSSANIQNFAYTATKAGDKVAFDERSKLERYQRFYATYNFTEIANRKGIIYDSYVKWYDFRSPATGNVGNVREMFKTDMVHYFAIIINFLVGTNMQPIYYLNDRDSETPNMKNFVSLNGKWLETLTDEINDLCVKVQRFDNEKLNVAKAKERYANLSEDLRFLRNETSDMLNHLLRINVSDMAAVEVETRSNFEQSLEEIKLVLTKIERKINRIRNKTLNGQKI